MPLFILPREYTNVTIILNRITKNNVFCIAAAAAVWTCYELSLNKKNNFKTLNLDVFEG